MRSTGCQTRRTPLAIAVASVAAAMSPMSAAAAEPVEPWPTPIALVNQDRAACPQLYRRADLRDLARGVFRRARIGPLAVHRLKLRIHCQRSLANERKVREFRNRLRWKRAHVWVWEIRFARLPAWTQAWARRISACESGNRQVAPEGGFLSYFQWTPGTWRAAGGRGNPETVPWYHQAVLAVRWMLAHGTMHWPACSQRLGYA